MGATFMSLVSYRELAGLGISWTRTHIDRLEKAGQFPKRIRLGPKSVRWIRSEVEAMRDRAVADRGR
jgi:prophage regulatory protein